jgi:hypothetical protein
MLFFSPWLFDLPAGPPRETALMIGLLIAVSSVAALAAYAGWEEWLNLTFGLGVVAAPWLLGFENKSAITLYSVIGTLVLGFAALELWLTVGRQQRAPQRARADTSRSPVIESNVRPRLPPPAPAEQT